LDLVEFKKRTICAAFYSNIPRLDLDNRTQLVPGKKNWLLGFEMIYISEFKESLLGRY